MDLASFIIASVACITVICYLAATDVKQTPLANKWLPSICGALGGLAAPGADQVIKQIGKNNCPASKIIHNKSGRLSLISGIVRRLFFMLM